MTAESASPSSHRHLAYQTHVMIGRLAAVHRSRLLAFNQLVAPLTADLIHTLDTEVTRHCYIINVRACDCSLLAGR